ncbi:IS3 family transposase [Escherichia coli]|nr:IS3 family transposase [Escherichia coli]
MPLLDKLREQYGVGPVCSELHIAPSTYYHCQQQRHHPDKRSARAQRDDWLKREIQRVYDENHQVYGVRKVWRQLLREGIRVARCTVARLMAVMGLAGVLRGKKVRTTVSRKAVAAGDRVNRQFVAERPDQLWWLILLTSAHGRASSMWRSSLMCFPDVSWGGESHRLWKRHSCWMHWSRRCGPVGRPAQSITVIKVLSMYHWPIRSD